MVKSLIITVLLLGDSQTAGEMGRHLERAYNVPGIEVTRESASGKGVDYFLSALPESTVDSMHHRQTSRIKIAVTKSDYIIFGSLGGNDATRNNLRTKVKRRKLFSKYKSLFERLCSTGAVVILNGSPRAKGRRLSSFDKRRAKVDAIQEEAAKGTCVLRNSTRSMDIPTDPDGYHYNRSGAIYARYLLQLPGMQLPFQESSNNFPL